ncbi:hypothetical protein B0H11DRAFT_1728095, partial [Mycena galericulata]
GDFCELNQFVIVKTRGQPESMFIAHVTEILQIKGSADDFSQRPSAILLQSVKMSSTADPSYGVPAIEVQNQWSLVNIADVLCTVNVQHNCNAHGCDTSSFRYVYQECQITLQTRPVVVHAGPADDLLLNTGQMRDAINVQPFRMNSNTLDSNAVITASVIREFEEQKAVTKAADGASLAGATTSGLGRGRGRGRATGLSRLGRVAQLQATNE